MTITIKKNTKVAEFQAAFNQAFAFLKPQFFHENLDDIEGTWSAYMVLKPQTTLGELSDSIPDYDNVISISRTTTIAEVENTLAQTYGLTVKVFRKHLNDWVETTHLRHLDLEGHNEMGRAYNYDVEDIIL